MKWIINLFWFILCALQFSCTKDIVDTSGNLIGVVSDARTGSFLSGALVSTSPAGKSYTTGTDGKYEFVNLESKEYTINSSLKNSVLCRISDTII